MSKSFSQFSDEVLIAAAEKQSASNSYEVILDELFPIEQFRQWGSPFEVAQDLEKRGLAEDHSIHDYAAIRVTGGGFRHIEKVSAAERAGKWYRRLGAYVLDNWIAIIALAVSIVALAKGE